MECLSQLLDLISPGEDAAKQEKRFIHIQFELPGSDQVSKIWVQLDESGDLVRLRAFFPITDDGAKEVAWQADKATVWFKDKNIMSTASEPGMLELYKRSFGLYEMDPRAIVAKLIEQRAEGKLDLQIDEKKSENELRIVVSAKDAPERVDVYSIDTATKLVSSIEIYRIMKGERSLGGRIVYLDYNKPVADEVFEINAPPDVIRADQTTQEIGLAQGDLSESEIQTEVVRQFFEALIAEDYDKAGRLLGGMPGDYLKKMADERQIKYMRIVSIEEPQPHPRPETGGFIVNCKVELRERGETVVHDHSLGVRHVYNQPERWDIFGGFELGS